jgi:hypothetical protein
MENPYEYTVHGFSIKPTDEERAELDEIRRARLDAYYATLGTDYEDDVCPECEAHVDDCECGYYSDDRDDWCYECDNHVEDCICDEDSDDEDNDNDSNEEIEGQMEIGDSNEVRNAATVQFLLDNSFKCPTHLLNTLNKRLRMGSGYETGCILAIRDAGVDINNEDWLVALRDTVANTYNI